MSQDVYDFRIAKLQRYIRRCHAASRPVPSAYAAIEHNLDPAYIRTWLQQRDRKTDELKSLIRQIAKCPGDAESPAPWE